MRKIISMLLAFSMSLSVMCSSFTVAAVDGNDTAAQTESAVPSSGTGFEGLFANEINEKVAEKSNDCGINSVEVNGNTATVSYWSSKDCTVLVGIYEDDGTKGTHMVTFGTANVKAAENEAAVTIDKLPQYFYLKAFLVDSESYCPLAAEYTNSNYTKSKQDFFDLTIPDFIEDGYDEDRIINLDGSDSNNFIVFDKRAKIINEDFEISVDDLSFTTNSVIVNNNADTDDNISKLKNNDPFLFFTENGILTGIVSGISYNGSTAVINYTEATTADVFDHVRIDTSDIVPRQSAAYSMLRSSNYESKIFPFSGFDIGLTKTLEPIKGNDSVSAELSITGAVSGELKVNYSIDDLEAVIELNITPKLTIIASGEGKLEEEIELLDFNLPIVTIWGVPAVTLNLNVTATPNISFTVSGSFECSTTVTAIANINESNLNDMLKFGQLYNAPESDNAGIDIKGGVNTELPVSISIGVEILKVKIGPKNDPIIDTSLVTFSLEDVLTATVNIEKSSGDLLDGIKHICEPLNCFSGSRSIKNEVNINVKSPVLELLSDGNKVTINDGRIEWEGDTITFKIVEIEFIPEAEQKFNVKLDPFKLSWGECDNYAYRTYFDVEDELTGDKLENIFVYTEDASGTKYSEDTTNRGGRAVLYLKPNESFKIGFRDTEYTYNNEDKYFTVTEPDEKFTVKMTVGVPPTYIEPRPAETEEVPTFFLGEKLRYNKLMVKYDERTYYIDFTDDMIKSFDPNTLGEQTLVIEYNGKTWSHKIKIIEDNRELQSVFLSPVPKKREYKTGESLDLGGAKLNAVYKNVNTGETETDKNIDITSDMISGFDTSTEGEKEVTVTFTDAKGRTASTSFNITVVDDKREVESIKIKTPPNKTEYKVGESLDITGLTIDVYFTDGTSDTGVYVSSSNVTGFDSEIAGKKSLTVTYTDKYGNEAAASFKVKVGSGDEVTGIEIQQLLTPNKYCQINGSLNLEKALIKVTYANGTSDLVQITEDMISGFDSSTLGTFSVTVTYGQCQTTYDVEVVENLKKVYRIALDSHVHHNVWQGDMLEGFYYSDTVKKRDNWEYRVWEFFLDGTISYTPMHQFEVQLNPDGSTTGYYEGTTILGDDGFGGKIKIEDFDINQIGVQEVKATYCNADGTPDPDVEPVSTWVGVHAGKSDKGYHTSPLSPGDIQHISLDISTTYRQHNYNIGESFDRSGTYWAYSTYDWNSEEGEYTWVTSPERYVKGADGKYLTDENGGFIINDAYCLTNPKFNYLGGFDSRYPTHKIRYIDFDDAYFEFKGFVIPVEYTISELEATSTSSETATAAYNLAENMQYADYSGYDDMEYYTPIVTEVPAETETPDNTEQETTEPVVTEPVVTDTEVTDTTVTEPQPEETTVTETASAEETPVFGNDSSGVFGFGRSGRKTAQYANLHKNDIYNYYVVRNASADILGRDNLLFVGQTSSDGNGSLSFEYETATGEDGTVILKPMSDDPTTPDKPAAPDTPSDPTTPGNGGSSPNTAVIPVNGTVTKTMTIKVENKVTGEISKARGQKKGSSVTVKLGTENDGCYANVYTTDDEYICSAIIENGRAKFNVSNDVKLKIVIDSFAYGEDVSTAAGAFGDSAAENLPYAAVTAVIVIVGIYFKKRSEKKVK